MKKKLIFNIFRIFISAGMIIFLFWLMRNNIGEVILAIRKADKPILFISVLCSLAGALFLAVRLDTIMKAQTLNINLREAIYLTLIGYFFNNFLPTSIGGDIVKIHYASKKTKKKLSSTACILLDRIIGTITLFLMVLASCLFVRGAFVNKIISKFLMITLTVSLIIALVLFNRKVAKKFSPVFKKFHMKEKLENLYDLLHNYKKHPWLLTKAVLISFLLQIIFFYAVYLLALSLGIPVPFKQVLLLMPIVSTVAMAPSINGLGVREVAIISLFGPLMGKEGAFALSILYWGLNFVTSLIGGALYLLNNKYKFSLKEV